MLFCSQVLSQFASDEVERERLCYFASAEGRDELYEYNQRERRTVLEVRELSSEASACCRGNRGAL